ELEAGPCRLLELLDAADQDVRTEAAMVDADGARHAVGEHRQRQDVVTLTVVDAVEANELRIGERESAHSGERRGRVPGLAVDERLAGGPERAGQAEQARAVA